MSIKSVVAALFVAVSLQVCSGAVPAFGQASEDGIVVVNSRAGKGTGTYIGNGRFLTAAHVTNGSDDGLLIDRDGATMAYTVVITSAQYDVAIVEVKTPVNMLAREIACRIPALGEDVEWVGHPLSWSYVHGFGRVASRTIGVPNLTEMGVFISGPAAQGQSGGPVFDKDGNIVGIVNAGMADSGGNAGYMLSVPGTAICGVLNNHTN